MYSLVFSDKANGVIIFLIVSIKNIKASEVVLVVESMPANAGDIRDMGSVPGSGRFPGGGHGNPLQYSCLENPMDRGAQQVTIHGVTQNRTQLKQLSVHTCIKKILVCE